MIKFHIVNSGYTNTVPEIIYENEKGQGYISKARSDDFKINVYVGGGAVYSPKPQDSIIILEPKCVSGQDYNVNFLNQFKYVFTWAIKAFKGTSIQHKIIEINCPSNLGKISFGELKKNWLPWNERSNEIVFIANNKVSQHKSELYSLRKHLADLFFKFEKEYQVSWYGQLPLQKPYFKKAIPSKFEVLRKAKFTVCIENCYDEIFSYNYLTEKLPEAWMAGTVPIYIGCYNIDELGFNKDSYIDLRDIYIKKNVNYNELINRIKSFGETKYSQLVNKILDQEKLLINQISYDRVFAKILDSYLAKIY